MQFRGFDHNAKFSGIFKKEELNYVMKKHGVIKSTPTANDRDSLSSLLVVTNIQFKDSNNPSTNKEDTKKLRKIKSAKNQI